MRGKGRNNPCIVSGHALYVMHSNGGHDMPVNAHHITINGRPLCQCQMHTGGIMTELNISCSFTTKAAAIRAKKEIQKRVSGSRVVKGPCPAFAGDF
jgi:hypothetical protein